MVERRDKMAIPLFLENMLLEQYGGDVTKKILLGYSTNRKVTLRVNTLKSDIILIKEALKRAGIEYTIVPWSENALIIENVLEKDIYELDIYKNGEIYLQSLSSMLPPIILEPKEKENILDMAAAPGGKTTQMAAITNNKSCITACEMNKIRSEKLNYNIQKQGASCVYVMQSDSRKLDDCFSFDKILLDAPCSGSGTITEEYNNISEKLIEKSVSNQLALLQKAIKLLKPGNEMVYSTCSILSCENEGIIEKILCNRNIEIVNINFEGIEHIPMLPTKIKGTLCVCPTELYEGFFVAKIRKK